MNKSCFPFMFLVWFIAFFDNIQFGSSILCYDCNSLYDPRCGDEFDHFHLGIVNCSLKDPLEHLPELKPSLCRSIRVEMEGKVRVIRKCGYISDETLNKPCQRKTSNDKMKMFTTYCSCDTDLCNGGAISGYGGILWVIAVVYVLIE